ncbi:MAG: hypothetical protein WDO71_21380 [Bacteroidota bacterium]
MNYYPALNELFNKLTTIGKVYAGKNNSKVNRGELRDVLFSFE